MTGTVEHLSLSDARQRSSSSQARLSGFSDDGDLQTTYIGVVSSDNEQLRSAVDEMAPELGPPDHLFYQWLHERDRLQDDSAVTDVQAHNQALSNVDYRRRFGNYLEANDDARATLDDLADRVADGENIVLVCYCGEGKWCHRQPVAETITSMVAERVSDE